MGLIQRLLGRGPAPASPAETIPVRVTTREADDGSEHRSLENPAFAINPAQLDQLVGYGPTRSGIQVNEHTALTFVAVYAAAKILGETLGMLPASVYEGDEDEKDRRRAKEHPVHRLLRRSPNGEMTAAYFFETLMGHIALWGNAYARIEHNNAGEPIALWPLKPDRTRPERFGGNLVYNAEKGGRFAPEEILHVAGLGFDGIGGYSPIAYAREAVATGKAAELFGSTFFGNGAQIRGLLKHPGKLAPEKVQQLREDMHAMHGGVGNAWKTMILHGGMEWQPLTMPLEDAQFLETRKFQVTEIARLYRIPPHMLGDHERATHSNIEQASLEFLVYTISPWLNKFEQEIDRKLLGGGGNGYYAKFNEKALLRADLTQRQSYYAAARQWGWMSANDVLRAEGDQTIGKQGDVYLSPANEINAKAAIDPNAKTQGASSLGVSGGAPGESPFGGKPAVPAGNRADAAAAGMQVVFEDAIGRMLRKEANADGRGKADADFYAAHRQHVIEALTPAVRSLSAMAGIEIACDHPALVALAAEKHGQTDPATLAPQRAGQLVKALLA